MTVFAEFSAVPIFLYIIPGGTVSHTTSPSGEHSTWVSHSSQRHHHHHHPSSGGVSGGQSDWRVCHTCETGYSPIDLGACPKCCPRKECKYGCGKPAFCSLELGSFGYCGAECRDRCELEGARREMVRALKEFEVNSGRVSSQEAAKKSVNHTALSQPSTRSRPQGNDTPTTVGATPEAPPTQQSPPPPLPPQGQVSISVCNYKLPRDVVRATSLYDRGKLQTVKGTNGVSSLVTESVRITCNALCVE